MILNQMPRADMVTVFLTQVGSRLKNVRIRGHFFPNKGSVWPHIRVIPSIFNP